MLEMNFPFRFNKKGIVQGILYNPKLWIPSTNLGPKGQLTGPVPDPGQSPVHPSVTSTDSRPSGFVDIPNNKPLGTSGDRTQNTSAIKTKNVIKLIE